MNYHTRILHARKFNTTLTRVLAKTYIFPTFIIRKVNSPTNTYCNLVYELHRSDVVEVITHIQGMYKIKITGCESCEMVLLSSTECMLKNYLFCYFRWVATQFTWLCANISIDKTERGGGGYLQSNLPQQWCHYYWKHLNYSSFRITFSATFTFFFSATITFFSMSSQSWNIRPCKVESSELKKHPNPVN
jgi:hypothetical protein